MRGSSASTYVGLFFSSVIVSMLYSQASCKRRMTKLTNPELKQAKLSNYGCKGKKHISHVKTKHFSTENEGNK